MKKKKPVTRKKTPKKIAVSKPQIIPTNDPPDIQKMADGKKLKKLEKVKKTKKAKIPVAKKESGKFKYKIEYSVPGGKYSIFTVGPMLQKYGLKIGDSIKVFHVRGEFEAKVIRITPPVFLKNIADNLIGENIVQTARTHETLIKYLSKIDKGFDPESSIIQVAQVVKL